MEADEEYFINFTTEKSGDVPAGAIDAVRVRLDMVRITDMEKKMRIDLCDHPLYPELKEYVRANP